MGVASEQVAENAACGDETVAIAWKVETGGADFFIGGESSFEGGDSGAGAREGSAPDVNFGIGNGLRMKESGGIIPEQHGRILMHSAEEA